MFYNLETGGLLTRGNRYVQGNKWILVSVVHMIHLVHKLNYLQIAKRQKTITLDNLSLPI